MNIMRLRKGDEVIVTAGKDKGKHGKVERVLVKDNRVLVPGVNLYKKHMKPRGQQPGGIVDIVRPLPVTNVALVCPNCGKATRIGYEIKKDERKRICRKCGKGI